VGHNSPVSYNCQGRNCKLNKEAQNRSATKKHKRRRRFKAALICAFLWLTEKIVEGGDDPERDGGDEAGGGYGENPSPRA